MQESLPLSGRALKQRTRGAAICNPTRQAPGVTPMVDHPTRRSFLRDGAGTAAMLGGLVAWPGVADADEGKRPSPKPGRLILNDDGHVFLILSDDLRKDDLRRYLRSYCRPGVDTVAYCVGDMSWPTIYPSKVGKQRPKTPTASAQVRELRVFRNLANFEKEKGG